MILRRSVESHQGAARPAIAPGRRIYCVGDIHGRADLLEELHEAIRADAAAYRGRGHVIYLGDYVDRGAESARVIDMLLDEPLPDFAATYLMGNHEQALLDFLVDPVVMAGWLQWGGQPTLRSYGVQVTMPGSRAALEAARDQFEQALPASHRAFIEACVPAHAEGDYYFVHAGVRPGVRLDRQAYEDQLWIREEFLASNRDHGAIIVHGHSISEEVEIRPNRIGIDTGAFYTGVLTALVLEGEERRFLQTGVGA